MKSERSHHGYKTFLTALESILVAPAKTKKFLVDGRLTLCEKKLLTLYLNIRENDFSAIDVIIADKSFEAYEFLNGLRYHFIGMALVYKGDYEKSEYYLLKAKPYFHDSQNANFIRRLEFKTQINLFYIYVNLKHPEKIKTNYDKLQNFIPINDEERIYMQLIDLCYNLMQNNYLGAEEVLEQLERSRAKMNDIQMMSYLIEKFDFFVKMEGWVKAEETLKEMKKFRTFRLSANYKFMDLLLKFITTNNQVYIYEKDFQDHEKLLLMMTIIKALDELDIPRAEMAWERLKEISPQVYQGSYEYSGDKCLFSISLQKALSAMNSKKVIVTQEISYTRLESEIVNAIQSSRGQQLKKEDLFFMVYKKEMQVKDDLINLSAVIYRINKKGGLVIKSKKGMFYLSKSKQAAA